MEETEVRKSGDGPCLYAHPCSLTLAKTEFQFFNPAKLLALAAGARNLSSSPEQQSPQIHFVAEEHDRTLEENNEKKITGKYSQLPYPAAYV